MDTYDVKISGSTTLASFQLLVEEQEDTGAQFVASTIASDGAEQVNLITLRNLPPGQIPGKTLQFLEGAAPASDNASPDWKGQLVCGGRTIAVSAFRT
jgi:hypothetical protein